MSVKQWLQKSFLERNKSTEVDYPPKRGKPWLCPDFAAMEHFHESNFGPLQGGFNHEASPTKFDTVHLVEIVPLTGNSPVACEPNPDGTRQFEVFFLRTVNGGPVERVPSEATLYEEVNVGDGEYTIDNNVVTVGINEPGEEFWTFRLTDTQTGSEGYASGSIFVEAGGFKYWRFYVTSVNESGPLKYVFCGVEFKEEAGGANICVGGAGSTNNERVGYDPTDSLEQGLYWSTAINGVAVPHWLQYEFPVGKYVRQYGVWVPDADSNPDQEPSAWELQRSNDGITWETVDTQTGITWTAGGLELKTFDVS